MGNEYFRRKNVHTYTKLTRGRNEMEIMIIKDFLLVKRDTLKYVHDLKRGRAM